jgi:hypothetical protein
LPGTFGGVNRWRRGWVMVTEPGGAASLPDGSMGSLRDFFGLVRRVLSFSDGGWSMERTLLTTYARRNLR